MMNCNKIHYLYMNIWNDKSVKVLYVETITDSSLKITNYCFDLLMLFTRVRACVRACVHAHI